MKNNANKLAKKIEKNEWSKLIKMRAMYSCEVCGNSRETCQLHAHHIERKKSIFMRILLANGICLCAKCHIYGIHDASFERQGEVRKRIINNRGTEFLDKLVHLRNSKIKLNLNDLIKIKKNYINIINNLDNSKTYDDKIKNIGMDILNSSTNELLSTI